MNGGVYTIVFKSYSDTRIFTTVIEMHEVSETEMRFLHRLSKASKRGLTTNSHAPYIDVYDGPPVIIHDDKGQIIFADYNEEKKLTND